MNFKYSTLLIIYEKNMLLSLTAIRDLGYVLNMKCKSHDSYVFVKRFNIFEILGSLKKDRCSILSILFKLNIFFFDNIIGVKCGPRYVDWFYL